jgi:hypothetical protein
LNDDHGDERNITMNRLQDAAKAAKISVTDAAQNIEQAVGNQHSRDPRS